MYTRKAWQTNNKNTNKKSIRNWIRISVQSLFATFTKGLQKYSSFGFSFKTLCSWHFLKLSHPFYEPYKCFGRNVAGRLNINKNASSLLCEHSQGFRVPFLLSAHNYNSAQRAAHQIKIKTLKCFHEHTSEQNVHLKLWPLLLVTAPSVHVVIASWTCPPKLQVLKRATCWHVFSTCNKKTAHSCLVNRPI